MKSQIYVAAIALLTLNSAAFAQNAGTPEDRAACEASVKRYCAKAIEGGDMVVLACLQQNRSRLTSACQQVLIKYGQ
jgi:hypothetical protein